jgi:hypothetical protein
MPNYKGTMFFGFNEWGWSESWYFLANDIQQAATKFTSLALARGFLVAARVRISTIRITDIDNPGVSLIRPVPPGAKGLNVVDRTDTPYNAVYVRISDMARVYRRQMMLRGIPDRFIAFDLATNAPLVAPELLGALTDFADFLRTGSYRMRVLERNPAIVPRVQIVGITFAAMTGTYTITAPAHGFVTGDLVRIGKTNGLGLILYVKGRAYRLRGPNRVTVTDLNTFTVTLPGTTTDPLAVTQFGYAIKQKLILAPIQNVEYQRYAKRNTGRPFFQPRGRRRASR